MKCSFLFEPAVHKEVAESQLFLKIVEHVLRLNFLSWTVNAADEGLSVTERKGEIEERIEYNEALFENKIIRKDHLQRRTIVYDGNIYVASPILSNAFDKAKKKVEKTVEVLPGGATVRPTIGTINEQHQVLPSLPAPVVHLTLLDILDYLDEDILAARVVFDKYADIDPDHMTLWSAYLGLLELTGLNVTINELFGIETTTEDAKRKHYFSVTYENFLAHYVRICQSTTVDNPLKNPRLVRKAKEQTKNTVSKDTTSTKLQIDLSPHSSSSSSSSSIPSTLLSSCPDKESMRRQRIRILEPNSPTSSLVAETKTEKNQPKTVPNVNRNQTRFNFSAELASKAQYVNPKDWFLMVELWELVMLRTNELLKVDTVMTGSSSQEPNNGEEVQMTATADDAVLDRASTPATADAVLDTISMPATANSVLLDTVVTNSAAMSEEEIQIKHSSNEQLLSPLPILLGTTKLRLLFNAFDVNSMYSSSNEKEEGNIFVTDWDIFMSSALEMSLFVCHSNQPIRKAQSVSTKRAHTAWWHVLLNEWRNITTEVVETNPNSISWRQVIFFLTWLREKAMNERHSLFKLIARDLYHRIVSDALQIVSPLSRGRSTV